jgi:hypothetical protein
MTGHHLSKRNDVGAAIAVRIRILLLQLSGNRGQVRRRALDRDMLFQTRYTVEIVAASADRAAVPAINQRLELGRAKRSELEIRRQHTRNGVRFAA